MKIAGKVQVDISHWHDLSVAAAGRSAFHAKAWTETGLPKANNRLLPNLIHTITQAHGCGCLAFAGRCRRYRRYQDKLAVAVAVLRLDKIFADFCLVMAVGNQRFRWYTYLLADFLNGQHICCLRNLNITFYSHVLVLFATANRQQILYQKNCSRIWPES